ncbi:MAG: methionyl-tRNA formyltransferase [Verrucomicrobiales bacterium]|jgi:methionyl-tRNA formyltransferase|nr:methionyl-tRNA formyltransferase [Verrucomicrobiales bacterium]
MKIVFIGSGEIGVPTLTALLASDRVSVAGVVTQPDRPAGRHLQLTPSPVKRAAAGRGVEIFQPENINTPAALTVIGGWRPDLAVVCAYGQILRPPLLALPPRGCLNLHASLLPKYRGAACLQAAIRHGDPVSGVTVMWMNAGLDTGDILLQRELTVSADDTAGTLHDRLARLAPSALAAALRLIVSGQAPRLPQDHAAASYAGKLKKADGHINWRQSPVIIERHVRAMSPWPSAFAWLPADGERQLLKIHRATIAADHANVADREPGTVLAVTADGVLVAADGGALWLREAQLAGRKRMSAAELARGGALTVGGRLW